MSENMQFCHKKMSSREALSNRGFTLVELMITMAISGLIMGAVYSAYLAQQRTYTAQDQVAEMQQNIRAALDMMTREIRMAGYDPQKTASAHIVTATKGRFQFTQDTNENGSVIPDDPVPAEANENITYGFSNANDADQDGVADAGAESLGRNTGGGYQPIAENIQAVEFLYFDSAGAVTADLTNIRSVQISILARAGRPDPDFANTLTYTPASGTPWDLNGAAAGTGNPANDNFRRRLLITTIQCRNMGL